MADPTANPDAVQALPLFPLGTAVFPGTLLPLRIFELRYLQMVGECERLNKPFGVVTLTQGAEVHRPGAPAERFEKIGTRMRLERTERPQPGLLHIWCRALDTFEVVGHTQRSDGLWLGEVRVLAPEPSLPVPEDLQHLASRLADALQRLQEPEAEPPPWPQPWRLDDCSWLSQRWAELLPLPSVMKYRLLALREPLLRLELIGDMLSPPSPGQSA